MDKLKLIGIGFSLIVLDVLATPRTQTSFGYFPSEKWLAALVCAFLCSLWFAVSKEKTEVRPSLLASALRTLSFVIFLFLVPQPFFAFGILVLTLQLASTLLPRFVNPKKVDLCICMSAVICVSQIIYNKSALYLDSQVNWSSLFSQILSLGGIDSGSANGSSYVLLTEQVTPVASGLSSLVPLSVCLALVLLIWNFDVKKIGENVALLVGFVLVAALRTAFIFSLSMHTQDFQIRTNEALELATLLFFVPLYWIQIKPRETSESAPIARSNFRWIGMAGVCLVVASMTLYPQGERKTGRVLLQEGNSIWEPFDAPVNTDLFGVRTMYNYTNLAQELSRIFAVTISRGKITPKVLENTDVLVLKCPTSPYESEEAAAIEQFVSRGGGVWFVSDHTDVFGMSVYLNELSSKYGFTYGSEAVIDENGGRQIYGSSKFFEHPSTARLREPYLFYTSCSIYASPLVGSSMIGTRMLLDKPDYSTNTFFGNFKPDIGEYFGPTPQTMNLEHGAGRISAWTDSTAFSGFCVFMPGQAELATDTIEWLNHKNPLIPWNGLLRWIGILLVTVAIARRYLVSVSDWATCICACTLSLVATGLYNTRVADTVQPPRRAALELEYISRRESFTTPLVDPIDEAHKSGYVNSFVSTQRLGFRPRIVQNLEPNHRPDAVVLNGVDALLLTPEEIRPLLKYVEDGGRLTLIDFFPAKDSPVLSLFGFSLEGSNNDIIKVPNGKEILYKDSFRTIKGKFDDVLLESGGKPVFVQKKVGRGTVALASTICTFSDDAFGSSTDIPTSAKIGLLRIYWQSLMPNSVK